MKKTFSIKESVDKTEDQRRKIENFMDENGYFSHKECNIYEGLKRSVQRELQETLRKITLKELLATPGGLSTGTLGTAGVDYLVPTWISQKLYTSSAQRDSVPYISADIFEPRGGDCTVPIGKVAAHVVGETGTPMDAYKGTGATIKLEKIVVPVAVTEEMIEDNSFGIVEWQVQQAGASMGDVATDLALDVLKTATDGEGTLNEANTGDGDETKFTGGTTSDLITAIRDIGSDEFVANTAITTPEAWGHSIGVQAVPAGWTNLAAPEGFNLRIGHLDMLFSTSGELHTSTDAVGAAFTNCITLVFDRGSALVTARKNWLQIENYSNPVKDLAGAVVSGRQDSVTIFNDSIYKLTET